MTDIETLKARYRKAHGALHRVWTQAVGTPGYSRDDWVTIQRALWDAFRKLADDMGHYGALL
jgi:hypothetical protein